MDLKAYIIKMKQRHETCKKNFTAVSNQDLEWLHFWAEYGVLCYKVKTEGETDELKNWRPSNDNRSERKEQSLGSECEDNSPWSYGNVLDQDRAGQQGNGLEGRVAGEVVRSEADKHTHFIKA